MPNQRCHYVYENGKRYRIPGCMAAAALGDDACTCSGPITEQQYDTDPIEIRLARLERRLAELEAAIGIVN